MNNVVRNEPWSLEPRFQDEINRLFRTFYETDSSASTVTWVPAVDIFEYQDRFELYVDLPGINPAAVELTLEHDVLTICGERNDGAALKDGEAPGHQRVERGQGRFYRRFMLPDTVDSDKVEAAGKNGVLTITIRKQGKALPRRIKIAA